MSIRASLLARLKRLEQQRGGPAEAEIKAMMSSLSVDTLRELSSLDHDDPSPRLLALIEEVESQCSTETEIVVGVLERLAAESARDARTQIAQSKGEQS